MSPPRIATPGAPRPRRRPRLVALDLDGTVLDDEQRLHPLTRAAVRAAVAGGTGVVVASGRMYRSALPWATELGVTEPLICYQGALVQGMPEPGAPERDGVPQGRVVAQDPVEASVALRVLALARSGGWHVQAYLDDSFYCEQRRPEADLYSRISGVDYVLVDDLAPLMARGSTKVVCVIEDAAAAAECQGTLAAALGAAARVVRSLPQFVEVTNPLAGKGRALSRLCSHLGVGLDEVVAVGDAPNDVDMLEAAGYAVGVEGAADVVLQAADVVCPPPRQAGVADVLRLLGLTPTRPGECG